MSVSDKVNDLTWREIRSIVWDNFCAEHDCKECKFCIVDSNGIHRGCLVLKTEDVFEEFLEQEDNV